MWRLNTPDWLIQRPIAHRGLHAPAHGAVENGLLATRRAVARDYAIECDVQASKDGDAIVFHDTTLARLLGRAGEIGTLTVPELGQLAYLETGERIARLTDLLAEIAGRVPLIIELKSRFDGDMRLAARVIEVARGYDGPLALKSFDPQILCWLRARGVVYPLGLVAKAGYSAEEWPELDTRTRKSLEALVDIPQIKPDFLSWHAGDLPHAVPMLCRVGMSMKVMVWTVHTQSEQARTAKWADQIIFEGFEP